MRKTILFLEGQAEMGGGEKSLLELVKNMDRHRFDPVVVLPARGPFAEALDRAGVRCRTGFSVPGFRRCGFLSWPWTLVRLALIARQEGAHLIHGNGSRENIAAGLVGRLLGIPVVWHLRNLVAPGMLDIEKPFTFLPRRIIANSRAVARRMKRIPWARSRLVVIYNGVDLDAFGGNGRSGGRGATRSELGAGEEEVLVGIVGRIGEGKGHELFLRAARAAASEEPRLRFAVIGDELFSREDRRGRLDRLVRELDLSDRVTCTGHRDDVERLVRALDLLVLASDSEPFGRVLIEAMAAGRPVVATDSGGVPEVVEGGVSGLLVRPGNVGLMAKAITRLSSDPVLRDRMGRLGRERAERKFSIERHVEKVQKLYAQLVGNNGTV
jgi:glycosyltransferase involved in cell wall biosynthesis